MNMAAYELSMNYRYGIIAYINGTEIYRDNMPDGSVSSTTLASGSYATIGYRSVIRPGNEISSNQCMLAVEIHFTSLTGQDTVDFNAFLAILASNTEGKSCFVYPYDATITTADGSNAGYAFDYTSNSYYYFTTSILPASLYFNLGDNKAYVNGIRIWSYAFPTYPASSFTFYGGSSVTSSSWTSIMEYSGITYTSMQYKLFTGYFNNGLYSAYRFQINDGYMSSVYNYEIQPLICSIELPTSIEYEQDIYNYYARYDKVNIAPLISEFTNCQITPTTSSGLVFDQVSCTLTGYVTNAITTVYTVSSTMNGHTYTGHFTLQITECAGSVVNLYRVYTTNAVSEGFTVTDLSTELPVLTIAPNSGQVNNAFVIYICECCFIWN